MPVQVSPAKPVIHPKVKAAGVAGLVAAVVLFVLSTFGAVLPGPVDALLSAAAAFLGGYAKS